MILAVVVVLVKLVKTLQPLLVDLAAMERLLQLLEPQ
jgi:hypothetical protein